MVSGTVEASDRKQALARLRQQGVRPLEVSASGGGGAASAASARSGGHSQSAAGSQPAQNASVAGRTAHSHSNSHPANGKGEAQRTGRGASAASASGAASGSAASAAAFTGKNASGKTVAASKSGEAATAGSAMLSGSAAALEDNSILLQAASSGSGSTGGGLFGRFSSGRALALPFLLKFRQLHSSGMSLGEVLQVMSNRMSDPQLKELSQSLYKDLSEGRTLAAAMRSRPDIFEPAMSYLIEAGEATGNLVPILGNIIDNQQERKALSKKIRSSLAYPCAITMMAIAVVGIFLFFLVPRIQSMLDSMGSEMGFTAALMIGMSEFALQKGPFILGAVLLAAFAVLRWRKSPQGRRATDEWLLRLPLVRQLAYNAEICRATNVLATLLGNGVNTTESLRLAENTLQNTILRERFVAARGSINDGSGFAAAFKRYGLLPDLDIDILSVGESTGSLVPSFEEVYRSHSEELTTRLSTVTKLVSGLALGFAFTLIFILTLSIVLSVMNVSQSMLG